MILLALSLAAAPSPTTAAPTPTAREIVERQLAKPAPAQAGMGRAPRLSAAEAEAIRARYLKSIGEAPRKSDDTASGATRSR